jgi:hypothetical protein
VTDALFVRTLTWLRSPQGFALAIGETAWSVCTAKTNGVAAPLGPSPSSTTSSRWHLGRVPVAPVFQRRGPVENKFSCFGTESAAR